MIAEQDKKIKQLKADLVEVDEYFPKTNELICLEKRTDSKRQSLRRQPNLSTYLKSKSNFIPNLKKRLENKLQRNRMSFNNLIGEFCKSTFNLTILRQHKLELSNTEMLKNQGDDLKRRQQEITQENEIHKGKVEKIQTAITEVVQTKAKIQTELDTIQKENNEAKRKQQEISDKLRDIHTQLNEAKHDIEVTRVKS